VTGNIIFDLAISLGGVAVLIGLSCLLGAMRSIPVTTESAIERLAFDEPDFKAGEWFIGADRKSAAAASVAGDETALVFAVGDGLATRRFRHGAVSIEKSGSMLVFRMGEPSLRQLRLTAPDEDAAEQWVLRLAGPRL
jgi:hypothetical protein